MDSRCTQAFLKGRHTNGQFVPEKMLNIIHHQGNANLYLILTKRARSDGKCKSKPQCPLTSVRMAINNINDKMC